jgi:hypothetical protein
LKRKRQKRRGRMPKKWTALEIAELKNLVAKFWTDEQISFRLQRTKIAIQVKRNRIIGSYIKCVDCGLIVKVKRGRKLRCFGCALKRTLKIKKKNSKNWFNGNRQNRYLIRNQTRYHGIRELIIQRDNYSCINCGMKRDEHKQKWNCDLTVSRLNGPGRDSKLKNNNHDNLITLCLSCQGKYDVKKRIQNWSMCGQGLKKWHVINNENKHKSTERKLNEGLRPKRLKNNMVVWL